MYWVHVCSSWQAPCLSPYASACASLLPGAVQALLFKWFLTSAWWILTSNCLLFGDWWFSLEAQSGAKEIPKVKRSGTAVFCGEKAGQALCLAVWGCGSGSWFPIYIHSSTSGGWMVSRRIFPVWFLERNRMQTHRARCSWLEARRGWLVLFHCPLPLMMRQPGLPRGSTDGSLVAISFPCIVVAGNQRFHPSKSRRTTGRFTSFTFLFPGKAIKQREKKRKTEEKTHPLISRIDSRFVFHQNNTQNGSPIAAARRLGLQLFGLGLARGPREKQFTSFLVCLCVCVCVCVVFHVAFVFG